MSNLPETELQSPLKKNPPGIQLRKAREAQGLSIKDIASRLHLSESVIDAIERDDYDHLPSSTFVRGYLRSYAALVTVKAESVIDAYNIFFGDSEDLKIVKDVASRGVGSKRASKAKKGKVLAYFGVILAVVIGIAYFPGQVSKENAGTKTSSSESEIEDISGQYQIQGVEKIDRSVDPDKKDSHENIGLESESLDQGVENSNQVSDDYSVEELPQIALEDNVDRNGEDNVKDNIEGGNEQMAQSSVDAGSLLETVPEKAVVTEGNKSASQSRDLIDTLQDNAEIFSTDKSEDMPEVSEPVPVESRSIGVDTLGLAFHADAWVEVHDANDDRLLYRLGKEGRTYRLIGKAPFRVLLGNANEVTVLLNDQYFDQKPFIRGQVARFSAGKKSTDIE